MPWQQRSAMSLREEFVALAQHEASNIRALCRRFGISPTTGYKWIERARQHQPLSDQSRKPKRSPKQCSAQLEQQVCQLRQQHPAWGARKLTHRLQHLGLVVPAVSTVHAVLRRNGLISAEASEAATPWLRFEHPEPNDLWQMDFKGHVAMLHGRCHPLTVLDDHSRYALCLQACGNEQEGTVVQQLEAVMRRYGVPARMTMDNGSPWGCGDGSHYTGIDLWLMRQGIRVSHSRPYHPQTQGKDERFHRTLKAEVLQGLPLLDLSTAQQAFDGWRLVYNQQRPHEALGMQVPVNRYRPSPREYCDKPAPPQYAGHDQVRKVQDKGIVSWRGQEWKVGQAFKGESVAVRADPNEDGCFDVFWSTVRIARLDLRDQSVQAGRAIV